MVDETSEIFDDVYLGLHAGAATRKQRRGEHLTPGERDALGRWDGLSHRRKMAAIGAFGVGAFGLGVAVGGLLLGRWRRA